MSGNQVSTNPTHHQPPTGPRTAPGPGPVRTSMLSTTSSAAASAGRSSISGVAPQVLPLPVFRTSSPTATAHNSFSSSTADVSNIDLQTTTRESSDVSSTDHDAPLPPGYPQLARKMGEMPEVAIFRRFGALNAQNLLYMQAELVCLEKRLHKLQAKDAAAPFPRSRYAVNWFWLRNSEDQGDGDDDEQWELVKDIRVKLKEYNEMLIQQMKIACVDPPSSWDLRHIQRYLVSADMDHGVLTGEDATLWGGGSEGGQSNPISPSSSANNKADTASRSDLLPLASRHDEDFFSSWVTDSMSEKLIKLKQRRASQQNANANPEDFADKKVLRWTFMVASVLASALPILAIAILYYVQSLKARLGLIAVFNVLMSFALAWFTSAKRAEVFAVSAAFSAVQVVFLQVETNGTAGG